MYYLLLLPVAFNVFSLTLLYNFFNVVFDFCQVDYYVSRHVLFFWIYVVWGSLCFLDLGGCFLSHAREVFSYHVFGYFSGSFSLSFGTSIMWMFEFALKVCPRGLLNCPHWFHSVFFILFHSSNSHHSVFQLTYPWFCLIYSAIDSFLCIFHFNYYTVQLFFISSSSLLSIASVFSVCAPFFLRKSRIHLYTHYSGVLFQVITDLCFTSLLFWGFVLFLHLEHIPLLSHFV